MDKQIAILIFQVHIYIMTMTLCTHMKIVNRRKHGRGKLGCMVAVTWWFVDFLLYIKSHFGVEVIIIINSLEANSMRFFTYTFDICVPLHYTKKGYE